MAGRYTYDDFQRELNGSGLAGQFSQSDLKLAQQNPDAGMSILKYKKDYASAATDEARALANLGAETVRSSWGGYTGGDTGGSFHLDPISPNDFSYGPAPTYSSGWTDEVKNLYNQQKNKGDYSFSGAKPTYSNRYDPTIQDLLNQIVNREEFSYDASTDPLYSQYRKQYAREGQRATADALGSAAAASGGIPSSYAATAAGQAGDYYASRMTDKIPELYQLAYNQYMNEHSMKISDLNAVQGAEQNDYMKYLNDLSQYNTDRSFDYGVWSDAQQRAANDLQTAIGLEQLDYQKYRDQLSQYNTDRNFNYSQLLDEIGQQTQMRGEALNKAQLAAGYGDYSFLNGMGINTDKDPAEWERQYNLAVLAAQYGDYSGLRALGVNPNANGLYQFNLAASGGPRSSGGSGGSRGGGGSAGSGTGQDGGIVASMLALGDDIKAYEYLIGLGKTSGVTSQLWELYQEASESAGTAGAGSAGAGSVTLTVPSLGGAVGSALQNVVNNLPGRRASGSGNAGAAGTGAGTGGAAGGGYSLNDLDTGSVLSLGLGPVSFNTVEQLANEGKVEIYTGAGGAPAVRWRSGWSANNYKG